VDPRSWDSWRMPPLMLTTTTTPIPVAGVGVVHLWWTRWPCNLELIN
jgi:hypothetical protein